MFSIVLRYLLIRQYERLEIKFIKIKNIKEIETLFQLKATRTF